VREPKGHGRNRDRGKLAQSLKRHETARAPDLFDNRRQNGQQYQVSPADASLPLLREPSGDWLRSPPQDRLRSQPSKTAAVPQTIARPGWRWIRVSIVTSDASSRIPKPSATTASEANGITSSTRCERRVRAGGIGVRPLVQYQRAHIGLGITARETGRRTAAIKPAATGDNVSSLLLRYAEAAITSRTRMNSAWSVRSAAALRRPWSYPDSSLSTRRRRPNKLAKPNACRAIIFRRTDHLVICGASAYSSTKRRQPSRPVTRHRRRRRWPSRCRPAPAWRRRTPSACARRNKARSRSPRSPDSSTA
jgi:hypothetical protein